MKSEVGEFLTGLLSEQRFGVLATVSEAQPHVSLMAFAASGDLTQVVVATGRETRKYANLRRNPRVALLVDNRENEAADTYRAVAVMARGTAEELTDAERESARAMLVERHPQMAAFTGLPECAVVRIRVDVYQVVSGLADVVEWWPG